MNLKQKLALKRYRILSSNNPNKDLFRKNALKFSRFVVLSILSFGVGICIYHLFGSPDKALYTKRLIAFFSDPFDGVKTPYEYICRVLFYATPFFIKAATLILSLISKNKQRAVFVLLAAVQFFQGLNYPISSELWENELLPLVSFFVIHIYQLTTVACSFLFCIYAYRLSLCFSLGFPNRKPAPGTTARFFSFTTRLFLWIILLVFICSAVATFGHL